MANPQRENGHTDIANEIMDALARTRIPGEARQVLDFILRKTYGWHKKEDAISLSQFVDGTGLSKQHVCQSISKLILMNLITKKGNVTEKGNEWCSTYGLNKDFHSWKPLPKKVTLPKKVMSITEKGKKSLPKKVPTKETITKETITKEKGAAAKNPAASSCVTEFMFIYDDMYKIVKKTEPPIVGNRDGPTVKRLLKRRDPESLGSQLPEYFRSSDPFIKNNAYDIPRFEKWLTGRAVGGYLEGGRYGKNTMGQEDRGVKPEAGKYAGVGTTFKL